MLEWIAMVIALSMPYQDPLADQQMPLPELGYVSVVCPIDPLGVDGDEGGALATGSSRNHSPCDCPDRQSWATG